MPTGVLDFSSTFISELMQVTGGDLKLFIGLYDPNTGRGHRLGMNIIDGGAAPNDTLVGITCGQTVANNKSISGWRFSPFPILTDERKFARWSSFLTSNFGGLFVNTPDPNFMTLHRFPSTQQTDTVVLSENGLLLMILSSGLWGQLGGRTVIFKWITDDISVSNVFDQTFMGRTILVTCATQQNGKIVTLGGPCPAPNNSKRWSLPVDRVMNMMLNWNTTFEVPLFSTVITTIRIWLPWGPTSLSITETTEDLVVDLGPWPYVTPFIKAKSDGNVPTRLLQLPPCP